MPSGSARSQPDTLYIPTSKEWPQSTRLSLQNRCAQTRSNANSGAEQNDPLNTDWLLPYQCVVGADTRGDNHTLAFGHPVSYTGSCRHPIGPSPCILSGYRTIIIETSLPQRRHPRQYIPVARKDFFCFFCAADAFVALHAVNLPQSGLRLQQKSANGRKPPQLFRNATCCLGWISTRLPVGSLAQCSGR